MGRQQDVCVKCQVPISASAIGPWVDRNGVASCRRGGFHEPGGTQVSPHLRAGIQGARSLGVFHDELPTFPHHEWPPPVRRAPTITCPSCGGLGYIPAPTKQNPYNTVPCGRCGGSGTLWSPPAR